MSGKLEEGENEEKQTQRHGTTAEINDRSITLLFSTLSLSAACISLSLFLPLSVELCLRPYVTVS